MKERIVDRWFVVAHPNGLPGETWEKCTHKHVELSEAVTCADKMGQSWRVAVATKTLQECTQ